MHGCFSVGRILKWFNWMVDIIADKAITVVSVSWRSGMFLRRLFANLLSQADFPDSIHFLVADNTNGEDRDIATLDVPRLELVPVDVTGEYMSVAHAIGLNTLMQRITTPFMLIVDPDVIVLCKGWDSKLREVIQSEGVVAAGAPYPPWKLGKYHDFPSPPFAFWRTDVILSLDPDWQPYAREVGPRFWDMVRRQFMQLSKFWDRRVRQMPARQYELGWQLERWFGVVSKDTGWEIADRARQHGHRALVFQAIHAVDQLSDLSVAQRNIYREMVAEFEVYNYQGQPFVAHMQTTQRGFSFALWSNHTIVLYRNKTNMGARIERWQELTSRLIKD